MLWEPVAEWARLDSDFDKLSPPATAVLYCTSVYTTHKNETQTLRFMYIVSCTDILYYKI